MSAPPGGPRRNLRTGKPMPAGRDRPSDRSGVRPDTAIKDAVTRVLRELASRRFHRR